MAIKIVTDSSADLPADLIQELGITVVPLYARFGDEIYRERVNITEEEFYQKLINGPVHPVTIQPSPNDFVEAYKKAAHGADGIISIHLSNKLSGTYNSAMLGKEMAKNNCPIEIIDSQIISAGLGLIVTMAAEAARAGKGMEEILLEVKEALPHTNIVGLLDTLKYLLLGGRIGKAKALVGSMLGVKPILTMKDGEVVPAGQVRSRVKGIERLVEVAKNAVNLQDLAVAYTTTPDEARALAGRLSEIFKKRPIRVVRMGTTLGVHVGPGTILIGYREGPSGGI